MNIPNSLSILRFFITFVFIYFILEDKYHIALALFMLQALTDLLDGFIARRTGSKTKLGAFLDPVADKTMLLAAFIMLYLKHIIPAWLILIIIGRDLIILIGFLFLYGYSLQEKPLPSIWGKLTTMFQILTIVYLLWSPERTYGLYLFYLTGLFTSISGLHYISRGLVRTLKRA